MTFQHFLSNFTTEISRQISNDCTPMVQTITKNNGTIRHAIALTTTSSNESPLIYIDSYYQSYCNGTPFPQLVIDFLEEYERCMPFQDSFPNMPQNLEQMKTFIFVKAVHYERNLPWLHSIPHRRQLDLAMIYEFVVPHSMDGYGFSVITYPILKTLGLTEEELHELAWHNMRLENQPQTLSIQQYDLESSCHSTIHILTNRKKAHGAAYIFDCKTLQAIANCFQSDLYIIPSSIHEVMIVPWNEFSAKEELDEMVKEVNELSVEPEEQLSDHVYVFHHKTGILSL